MEVTLGVGDVPTDDNLESVSAGPTVTLRAKNATTGEDVTLARPVTVYLPFQRQRYNDAVVEGDRGIAVLHAKQGAPGEVVGGGPLPLSHVAADSGHITVSTDTGALELIEHDAELPSGLTSADERVLGIGVMAMPGAELLQLGSDWHELAVALGSFSEVQVIVLSTSYGTPYGTN
jgi:hypothetical protein